MAYKYGRFIYDGRTLFYFVLVFYITFGYLYIYCQRHDVKQTKWVLRGYSAFKNFIILFLLGSLLGLNTFQDTKEIYQSIVSVLPFLMSDFLMNSTFIILWLVLSFSEVYIIKVYTNIFILRMNKNNRMK